MFKYHYVDSIGKMHQTDSLDNLLDMLLEGCRLPTTTECHEHKLDNDCRERSVNDISTTETRLPLYDINSNKIFLIHHDNIFPRILYDKYRFIDLHFLNDLKTLKDPDEPVKKILAFLDNYDMQKLYQTYYKIFYQSFIFNSYITSCQRPSFAAKMDHIEPYYSSRELYFLAYDWDLLKGDTKPELTDNEMQKLCKKIIKYDIPAQTLLDHQLYIYSSKAIGLVKHYSLFGSYFMNKYLREYYCCLPDPIEIIGQAIKNLQLETQIKLMIKFIQDAPAFTSDHTVYRFIDTDDFLKEIKVGDIYQDSSFMSTTRNPFYYQDNYLFGYILMKIRIPAKKKGIGLCIESYSNFPQEEEIILPPSSRLRLEKIIEIDERHTHILDKPVKKKYEFTLLDNNYMNEKEITLNIPNAIEPENPLIDMKILLEDPEIKLTSISDRLRFFVKNYVSVNMQFRSLVGDKEMTFIIESYDSSTVYKKFFYNHTQNGLLMYSFNPKYGNINLMLEIDSEIHVNYYFRYSVTDSSHQLDLDNDSWIEWLSLFAYIVGARDVIIHGNYYLPVEKSNISSEKRIMHTRYTYCQNIYQYLKNKKKWFSRYLEIIPGFEHYSLDQLNFYASSDILNETDKDELYQIAVSNELKNIASLYIYIIENHPKLIKLLEEKIKKIYLTEKDPFENIYYKLDTWTFLYNREIIRFIPSEKEFVIKKGSFKSLIGEKKIPKFKNRLRTYLVK